MPNSSNCAESRRSFTPKKLGYLVLTRMEDVSDLLKNTDIYSAANLQDPVPPICDAVAEILATPDYNPIAVMSDRARPDHIRIRKYTLAGFSGRRMRILEPFIRRRCESMVDAMLASGSPAEFVGALGHPLPGETIFHFISFPEEDNKKLKDWTTNRLAFTLGTDQRCGTNRYRRQDALILALLCGFRENAAVRPGGQFYVGAARRPCG
jgi:cytochrome P450